MLRLFAAVILGLLLHCGAAQNTTEATCLSGFNWSFNSLNQSPCDVAAALAGVCVGTDFTLAPLAPGFVYLGPPPENANSCRCSSVYYSLLSACAVCQDRDFIKWSVYKANCSVVFDQVYSQPIPPNIRVPHYAYLDVETADTFNITLAETAGGTESTSVPSATGPLASGSGASATSPANSGKKKSNAGAIAGGVVGGVVAIALIATLIFWLLRRNQRGSLPSPGYGPVMTSQNPLSGASSSYAATPAPKVYDPNDPSTYPTNFSEPSGYNPYTPSPDPHQQPYPTHVTPNFTGTTVTSGFPPARPQYTGAPEL